MDTRVAVISIIVEDNNSIETLNQLLYDARDDIISALSGKIGRLKGVSTKTAYSNVITHMEEKHD